jgi:hypothetical protein
MSTTKKKKLIYNVSVRVDAEVNITVSADSVQEAVAYAAGLNAKDIIQPADDSCEMTDWNNQGIVSVSAEGYVPFKS